MVVFVVFERVLRGGVYYVVGWSRGGVGVKGGVQTVVTLNKGLSLFNCISLIVEMSLLVFRAYLFLEDFFVLSPCWCLFLLG